MAVVSLSYSLHDRKHLPVQRVAYLALARRTRTVQDCLFARSDSITIVEFFLFAAMGNAQHFRGSTRWPFYLSNSAEMVATSNAPAKPASTRAQNEEATKLAAGLALVGFRERWRAVAMDRIIQCLEGSSR